MLGAAYGMRPAELGTRIHNDVEALMLSESLRLRQSVGRVLRNKCPHLSVCPKVAYHPTIQAHPAPGEPPMLGEFQWGNIPDRGRDNIARIFRGSVPFDAEELRRYAVKDTELGYTILHRRCETGRHSTGVNIQNIPKKTKIKMNKQERNAAVRELDSTEATIAKLNKQAAQIIATDQKKLDALERKLNQRRDKIAAERDKATRPLHRRAQYLRHELAGAF